MDFEIKGKLIELLEFKEFTKKDGTTMGKQEFLIEYIDNKFTKKLKLVATTEKAISHIQSAKAGSDVTCKFTPESREYNGKYYTDVNVWYVAV